MTDFAGELPQFRTGQRWEETSARELQNLSDIAKAVQTLQNVGSFDRLPGIGTIFYPKPRKKFEPQASRGGGTQQLFLGRVLTLVDAIVTCRLMVSDTQDGKGDPIQAIARKAFGSGEGWDWARAEPPISAGDAIPLIRIFPDGAFYTHDYIHFTCSANAAVNVGGPSREIPSPAVIAAAEGSVVVNNKGQVL